MNILDKKRLTLAGTNLQNVAKLMIISFITGLIFKEHLNRYTKNLFSNNLRNYQLPENDFPYIYYYIIWCILGISIIINIYNAGDNLKNALKELNDENNNKSSDFTDLNDPIVMDKLLENIKK